MYSTPIQFQNLDANLGKLKRLQIEKDIISTAKKSYLKSLK